MTIYPIKWLNEQPRHDLEDFVQARIKSSQEIGELGSSPKGLGFHHMPIIEDDYEGPAVILTSTEDGDVWVCEYVMPTEGGGGIGIEVTLDDLRDSDGNLPAWLRQHEDKG